MQMVARKNDPRTKVNGKPEIPCSKDGEMVLASFIMAKTENMRFLLERGINEDYFYMPIPKAIFRHVKELYNNGGQDCDIITLNRHLQKKYPQRDIRSVLADISDLYGLTTDSNFEIHVQDVINKKGARDRFNEGEDRRLEGERIKTDACHSEFELPKSKDKVIHLLEKTAHNGVIDPSQDFVDGVMYYAVKIDGKPYLINSEKALMSFKQAEENGIRIKTKSVDTFRFSSEGILQYYKQDKRVKVSEIYQRIYGYVGDYVFFKNDSHRKFLTVWVIGTYIFKVFRFYPYVWLKAPKQSGKTLLMEILMPLCFNGDLSTNATESTIFRDVDANSITMFLDEVERLRKQDTEKYGAIMSILNSGFSDSGIVKRTSGKNQNFVIQRFSTYSPKMFAGIKEIDDVVQDRTIKISMVRKKQGEVTKRYKLTDYLLKTQKEIRDDLYIFGLQYAKDIADIYNSHADELIGLEHLDNRELDIWEAILTIANVIDVENGDIELTDSLSKLSRESIYERFEDDKDLNETVKILTILNDIITTSDIEPVKVDGNLKYYDTHDVFKYFQRTDEYSWMDDKNKTFLTKTLKNNAKVLAKNKWSTKLNKAVRVYEIDTEKIQDLKERYITLP